MASADVRDVFDLPAGEVQPRPAKKQKVVEKRPGKYSALVRMMAQAPLTVFRENKPFLNPARNDGLVLRHWQRKGTLTAPHRDPDAMLDSDPVRDEKTTSDPSSAYHFAKFNVTVEIPKYTESEYTERLQDDDWSKEETDYLLDLCRQFDLRWTVIIDRYNFVPPIPNESYTPDPSDTLAQRPPSRTMEQLKARFYLVSASVMTLHRPLEHMTPQEYAQHEILQKFDSGRETTRKAIVTNMANRSAAEAEEEAILLTELRRILNDRPVMAQERAEIVSTLQSPPSTQPSAVASLYQSSAGLSQLMSQLLQADKHKKQRRTLLGANADSAQGSSPVTSTQHPHANGHTKGGSISGTINKKQPASARAQDPEPRMLTKAEEVRYAVTHHDRLASGAVLRHERVHKLATGKSHVQTARLTGALTELQMPTRLVMPTARVCDAFEKLINGINGLLDVRKQREKLDGEFKIMEASRPSVAGDKDRETNGADEMEIDGEEGADKKDEREAGPTIEVQRADEDGGSGEGDGGQGDRRADPEPEKAHKRSASVLSQASQQSTTKRARKAG
ncbi:MAG: DNA methyltransferase 1-associated protein 1 [Vezdaea aestivalis]|nr:MAG: DNA methyltransferase 1-associated protein 1 [Vezdaea aestivalis]